MATAVPQTTVRLVDASNTVLTQLFGGGVDASAPGAVTLTWAAVQTDSTPGFTVATPHGAGDVTDALAGDVLRIESSSGVLYVEYTLQAADVANPWTVTGVASADPLADGSYAGFRARLSRTTHNGQYTAVSNGPVIVDTTAPSITSASSTTVAENATLAFTVTTSEAATVVIGGTDAALVELASNPSATSRVLRWASNTTRNFESAADSGGNNVYDITLTPTDAAGNAGSAQAFTITVTNVNEAPTVANTISNQSATDSSAFSFQFASNTFADVDSGDTLTYTAALSGGGGLPAWLTFTAGTRTFSGTPATGDIGTITIRVTATDSGSLSANTTFDLVVNAIGATANWQLEDASGFWQLEDASGNWILE